MKNEPGLIVTTSWDDGQRIDLKLAKLLDKYNLKGTFYVTKSYRNPLTQQDLLYLEKCHHELGAHTLNHVKLTRVSKAMAYRQCIESKIYLEKIIGHKVNMFS